MTDTIPSTLRMLQDRDADRIGYGQDRDLRDRPEIKMSMSIPNVKGWFGYLKPGYVIEGNRTSNSYTGGFERSREGNREVTPVSGESSIAQAGYGYNYPMQFWPSRNNTQQPVGFVTPNKDDPNAIASIRFRPQLRTLNFEPNLNKGWWGYWKPVEAPFEEAGCKSVNWIPGVDVKCAEKRDASPKFLLGYKDIAYGEYNRYRSRHAMPCTGGAMGQVTCLPCMGSTVNNAVTGQNTQCEVLSFSRGFQNIPQVWKDVMNEAGVEWRDGRPTDIENLKVQDLFPCPMPDLVHRLGPANIPHDVMSSLGVTDVQDDDTYKNVSSWGFFSYANFLTSSNIAKPYEGVTLPNGRPQPYSYDQKGKDTPEANFYTCEYKSGAIGSPEQLKTFLEYVNEGEVAPCCTTNPSESCTFVPGNATIPFLQGMPDDFAANLLTNFEINFAQKQKFCEIEQIEMLDSINNTLNSVSIRSGNHGKLRSALLNLRQTLLGRDFSTELSKFPGADFAQKWSNLGYFFDNLQRGKVLEERFMKCCAYDAICVSDIAESLKDRLFCSLEGSQRRGIDYKAEISYFATEGSKLQNVTPKLRQAFGDLRAMDRTIPVTGEMECLPEANICATCIVGPDGNVTGPHGICIGTFDECTDGWP
jgi:hypothetical protein